MKRQEQNNGKRRHGDMSEEGEYSQANKRHKPLNQGNGPEERQPRIGRIARLEEHAERNLRAAEELKHREEIKHKTVKRDLTRTLELAKKGKLIAALVYGIKALLHQTEPYEEDSPRHNRDDRTREAKDSTESEVIDELENAINLPSQAEIRAYAMRKGIPLIIGIIHEAKGENEARPRAAENQTERSPQEPLLPGFRSSQARRGETPVIEENNRKRNYNHYSRL